MANVWKQLFHETIPNLAYTANTIGQSRFGVENIVSSLFKNGLTLHWHPGRDHPAGGAARRTRTTRHRGRRVTVPGSDDVARGLATASKRVAQHNTRVAQIAGERSGRAAGRSSS